MKTLVSERKKIFFIPLILVAIALFSLVTMLLWNFLMPEIFQLPQVSFWQALGLLILARLFFGGGRPYWNWRGNYLRSRLKERISKMTPEEREDFFMRIRNTRHSWHRDEYWKKDTGADDLKTEEK